MCGTSLHTIWPERPQHGFVNIEFHSSDNGLLFKPAGRQMCRTSLHTIWPERSQHICVNIVFERYGNGLSLHTNRKTDVVLMVFNVNHISYPDMQTNSKLPSVTERNRKQQYKHNKLYITVFLRVYPYSAQN